MLVGYFFRELTEARSIYLGSAFDWLSPWWLTNHRLVTLLK